MKKSESIDALADYYWTRAYDKYSGGSFNDGKVYVISNSERINSTEYAHYERFCRTARTFGGRKLYDEY